MKGLLYVVNALELKKEDPYNNMKWNDILPLYFKEAAEEQAEEEDAITSFLESGEVKFGKTLSMPRSCFVIELERHARTYKLPFLHWDKAVYQRAFEKYGIGESARNSNHKGMMYPKGDEGGRMHFGKFLTGCDVVKN